MLNSFQNYPRALYLTIVAIVVVSALVGLERLFTLKLNAWSDISSTLFTFFVISSKTLIPFFLLWKIAGLKPGCLGWVQAGRMQALWKAIVLAAVMLTFAGVYQKYSHLVFGTPYVSTGGNALQSAHSPVAITLLLIASLLNAFGEEIIFRGMLLLALSTRCGIMAAVILQSIIFTVYHFFPLQNSVLLFFMGILFALGYLWSGSLLTPVIAHLIENGTGSAFFIFHKFF
jgi:membrane protease YdiL (CAAX protease family)